MLLFILDIWNAVSFEFLDPRFWRSFELFLCAKKALYDLGSQLGSESNMSANSEIPMQNLALLVKILSRELGLQKSIIGVHPSNLSGFDGGCFYFILQIK